MNLFIPKGQRYYHAFFRVRDRSKQSGWRQVLRSCQTVDFNQAQQTAARIFLDEVAKGNAADQGPSSTAVDPCSVDENPSIEALIALHQQWMDSASPGERRPSQATAHNYHLRIRQLTRLLSVKTISELSEEMKGLTPSKLGVTDENFVPLIRNAAGIFRSQCMNYYREHGIVFAPPFKSGPRVRVRQFIRPPTSAQLERLKCAAETELRPNFVRDYLLFLLILHAGCRAQEGTHVQWRHVVDGGVWIHEESGSCSALQSKQRWQPKTGKNRFVPLPDDVIATLNQFRGLPRDFVVHDGLGPGKIPGYTPRVRASRVCRRLSKWIRSTLAELLENERNPQHWARKVFGSVVADVAGVPTAGEYLGHVPGSPVTAQTYVGILRRNAISIAILPNRNPRSA